MKQKRVIDLIRIAGYHDDYSTGLRLYIENRVSYISFQEAFQAGARARITGLGCSCYRCKAKEV